MRASRSFVVVVLGADGSGKTTLVKALCAAFSGEVVGGYFGEKEFRIGLAEHVLAMRERKDLSPFALRGLKVLYEYLLLPLDLLWRRSSLAMARVTPIIVIDRVPGFPFVSGRPFLGWLYRTLLPKPTLVVLLGGDAAVLAARKPDATEEGIAYDTQKFRKVARELSALHVIEIDTTRSDKAETLHRVTGEINLQRDFAEQVADRP